MTYATVGLRKAVKQETDVIYSLIAKDRFRYDEHGNKMGSLLLPTIEEIQEWIGKKYVFVLEADRRVVGCVATVEYRDIIEMRSLVIDSDYRGRDYSRELVEAAATEAKKRNYQVLYTLTNKPNLFSKYGFVESDVLLEKVAENCIKCIFYNDCQETTMAMHLH